MGKKARSCVILDCDKEAVCACGNCNMAVCDKHSRRQGQFSLCVNCYEYMRKAKMRH